MLDLRTPEQLGWALALFLVLAGLGWVWPWGVRPGVFFPGTRWLRPASGPARHLGSLQTLFRLLAAGLLALAVAGPELRTTRAEVAAEGVDIVLALDISTSMSARDFPPDNRLEAARRALQRFIERRVHDRLALITFAAEAYVACPLTTDRESLSALLGHVQLASFEADGTAIGLALAAAVNRLRDSPARDRVVVLFTDGVNNRGEISPVQAAGFCGEYGIRVYPVGVGTLEETEVLARARDGRAVWVRDRVDYDPEALRELAEKTGGTFFAAADPDALDEVCRQIDGLERSVLEHRQVEERQDLTRWVLAAALLVLFAAMAMVLLAPATA